ncbi:MAG: YqaA family protein [Chlamydiota bacterium]|nr:YqaA family protein [Chlamydiota bacterium]
MHWIKDLYHWVIAWAGSPYGVYALFFLAFAESSFFPIPPDVLLIAMCVDSPEKSFFYAFICTMGSALGGAFGYGIGLKGGLPILRKFISQEKIDMVHRYFDKYEVWAIGIAGFTPIPYKVFTISAGVFYIRFIKFFIVSVISRGARFFLVATLFFFYGGPIKAFIEKYFNVLSIVFIVLLVGGFFVIKKMAKHAHRQQA